MPGLTEYLLETTEKHPSKVLRLYAMQHLSLWFNKEGDPAKRREMVGLLEKLASRPGEETAGCAVLMLADMRRQTQDCKAQHAREEGAGSLAGSSPLNFATPSPPAAAGRPPQADGIDWDGIDQLVSRESARLIGDARARLDVRIGAIHACVDRKDAAPLPEVRKIAADKSLVSTLRKAAIHAIGQLGDDEDLTLLESLPEDDRNLSLAVGPARTALIKRKSGTKKVLKAKVSSSVLGL